jgi:hypothetical protein
MVIKHASILMETARTAVRQLVDVAQRPDGAYFSLPLNYPSGATVVIRVDGGPDRFFITDFGMGQMEADLMGAAHIFARHAQSIAEASGVGFDQRVFFVLEARRDQIAGAIVAVASCSHEAVLISAYKLAEKATHDEAALLYERLVRIFSPHSVMRDVEVVGSTNTKWTVAAAVQLKRRETVFDVVAKHPTSVAFTSTKFHDIARLERPPNRVAVVSNKAQFGTYLGILSMDASVIERTAPDETYIRLAEAA